MTKQKHLVLTLDNYFKYLLLILVVLINYNAYSNEEKIEEKKNIASFPAVVIDMKKVLSKSTAFTTLQKQIQKLEESFKKDIKAEEDVLKKEQENLLSQKSILSDEQFKEKENAFKQKVNKIQSKVEKVRRDLESNMARGMQVIQQEAVKHMKEISIKEGYLLVFDANSTIIAADKINISNLVADKLNKSLPKVLIEKNKVKQVDK
jgi:Skp family chaperone for outer membrane proteins